MATYYTNSKDVGERIKRARENAGLTQKELGEKLNVSASMIGQYETGVRNPKRATLLRIADALGVSFSYLRPTLEDRINDTFIEIANMHQNRTDFWTQFVKDISPTPKTPSPASFVSHEDIISFATDMAKTAREKYNLTEEEYNLEYNRLFEFYKDNGIPVVNDKLPLPIDAAAFSAFLANLEPEGQAKALQCVYMLGKIQDEYILTTYQKPTSEEE